jgi:hypothetical protein
LAPPERVKLLIENQAMIILVTHDTGWRQPQVAASIAADLNLDLISEEQLGYLVAQRMRINLKSLQRLIAGKVSVVERWLGERRRLAWYTADEIAKLAARGDVVVQSWSPIGSLYGISRAVRVHIGHPAGMRRPGASYCCQATISVTNALSAGERRAGDGQEQRILSDLVLAAALQSVTGCVQQLRQLASEPPAPLRSAAADATEPDPDQVALWSSVLAPRFLQVEIGDDRMPLTVLTSSEQAIAQIEEHLHGKRFGVPQRHRLPLPPGIL